LRILKRSRQAESVRTLLVTLTCCCAAAGGCGAADPAERPPADAPIALPQTPGRAQCSSPTLADVSPPLERGLRPGTYLYRLRGVESIVGQRRQQRRLPRMMEVVVTSSRQTETVSCFNLQRRFRASLAETATFATAATALYVRRVLLQTPSSAVTIEPEPPLLVVSARTRRWSGTFRGRTRGHYEGRVVERRTIVVAGKRVKAVRVALDVSFSGEVTGSQHSERWFSLRRGLLLRERVVEWRRIGLDELRIRYRAVLDVLEPRSAG
jgi:hypothetical protein